MITKEQIAKAVSYNDAIIEEHGSSLGFFEDVGVNPRDLIQVAEQRALRAILVMREGCSSAQRYVDLTDTEKMQLNNLQALFLDGFAARCTVENMA